MARILAAISILTVLVGCGARTVEDSRVADLGEFRLAHNIVIASKMQAVPGSRDATEEEIEHGGKIDETPEVEGTTQVSIH